MEIACLDLEGVLVPEIWINVAQRTGIAELRATTRDMPDYDALMKQRIAVMQRHGLGLQRIQAVIDSMTPLVGARDFLDWMRERYQVVILSDTFYEFAAPLMRQLGWPTLFCNRLKVDGADCIVDYRLRQTDPKRQAVKSLQAMNFRIIAAGDSYNDATMLTEADAGILFRPPESVAREFFQFPVTNNYDELKAAFTEVSCC
ncbi:MAG: bifunctional phosphoserine phosphatase/homoserine phosphotransferase ThrH [Acidiferrobacterales bacterium]